MIGTDPRTDRPVSAGPAIIALFPYAQGEEVSYERVAERQFGLLTIEQLRTAGLSDRAIFGRVRSGRLIRVARGVYRLPGSPRVREQAMLAAQLAIPGSALAFRSAGALWAIDGVRPVRPELLVTAGRSAQTTLAVVRRSRSLVPGDLTRKGPFVLTTPGRTLCDLAGLVSSERLEAAVDSSVTQGLVQLDDILRRIDGPRHGITGISTLRAIVLDHRQHGTPGSPLETRAVRALRKAGLPRPISQYEIRRSDGSFVARADLAYPDLKLVIELDGDRYHSTRAQRRSDRTRSNAISQEGYAVFRFDDHAVRSGDFTRTVRACLRER